MAEISGGKGLERALEKIAEQVKKAATLRVGFLENAKYPDGTPVAMVAAIQDFGAPSRNIPPRPFFRNMVKVKSKDWPAAIAALLAANNMDAYKALDLAGHAIEGQLRQSIIDTNAPPLKPATVARKGFAKPLIDTSHMIQSIDHDVA